MEEFLNPDNSKFDLDISDDVDKNICLAILIFLDAFCIVYQASAQPLEQHFGALQTGMYPVLFHEQSKNYGNATD